MPTDIADGVAAIARIDVVPTILEVICRSTGMGFSAVARVTDQQWIACAVRDEIAFGLKPGGELRLETTICNEVRRSGELVVIDHVALDDCFRNHPTPKLYGFESYISVPIRLPDGQIFGTLCAIDPRPARLNTPETVGMFTLYADLIGRHLEAQDRLTTTETALLNERQRTELQEQLIAVLGHDLRTPLSAIQTGIRVLHETGLEGGSAGVTTMMARSAARMSGLIDDILDFARVRLGGGLQVRLKGEDLEGALQHVIDEVRTVHPDRVIHSALSIAQLVPCDRARVGRLLSNLLTNALVHGDQQAPVWVAASTGEDTFELSVTNLGRPLSEETWSRLFRPFARGATGNDSDGLGLGLYIASEIARAHGGSIDVSSSDERTRFTFSMPLA